MDSAKIDGIVRRIKEVREDHQNIIEKIDEKLDYVGRSIEKILERQYMLQSKYNIYLGYGITSLRNVSSFNWDNIFQSIRAIEKVLNLDPIGVYQKMDSQSKEYYRYNIKLLAERLGVQEIFIAKKVLEFAKEKYDKGQRDKMAHVGYYIVDKGRKELFNYFGHRIRNHSLYMGRFKYYALPIILVSLIASYLLTGLVATSNIYVNILKDTFGNISGFELKLGGDAELTTFIEALEFALKVLKDQSREWIKHQFDWFIRRMFIPKYKVNTKIVL